MFFFIIGVNSDSKQIGNITNVICPSCGAYTSMQFTVMYEVLYIFFIPVLKFNRRYFATSYCCNQVFKIDTAEGKAFEHGQISSIDLNHLHKTDNYYHSRTCPNCGTELPDGARYCYMCGKSVR